MTIFDFQRLRIDFSKPDAELVELKQMYSKNGQSKQIPYFSATNSFKHLPQIEKSHFNSIINLSDKDVQELHDPLVDALCWEVFSGATFKCYDEFIGELTPSQKLLFSLDAFKNRVYNEGVFGYIDGRPNMTQLTTIALNNCN